jgi:TolB protein
MERIMKHVIKIFGVVFILWLPLCAQPAAQEGKEFNVWPIPNIPNGAEFYFSPDGKSLIGNAKFPDDSAHHVYIFNIDGTNIKRINDKGEDACSYFFPDGKHIVFTSTKDHLDLPKGNWSDANNYPQGAELYIADVDGSNVRRLTNNNYYDAEVSVSPDGQWILFTRQIDGQLDLWKIHPDGTGETQITKTKDVQEGGSFFLDNHTIIYRAWNIKDQGGRGTPMQIFTINDDGTNVKQITHDPGTNWAPFVAPDGDHVAFVKLLPPHNFEIFLISIKTGEQTRLTFNDAFDGFPVISPDGKLLTFDSNRDAKKGERTLRPYLLDISSLHLWKDK